MVSLPQPSQPRSTTSSTSSLLSSSFCVWKRHFRVCFVNYFSMNLLWNDVKHHVPDFKCEHLHPSKGKSLFIHVLWSLSHPTPPLPSPPSPVRPHVHLLLFYLFHLSKYTRVLTSYTEGRIRTRYTICIVYTLRVMYILCTLLFSTDHNYPGHSTTLAQRVLCSFL